MARRYRDPTASDASAQPAQTGWDPACLLPKQGLERIETVHRVGPAIDAQEGGRQCPQMQVGIDKAWQEHCAPAIDDPGGRATPGEHRSIRPHGDDAALADGHGLSLRQLGIHRQHRRLGENHGWLLV